ncbi:MAG TPA: type II secretion system protein [Anaeromyxobacteraceae bacterium]|nr:type II secretion system protein [Anaeromyxobacteraceae bacterium]
MSATRQRGFTLLEVTIAVAITAVMAAMALGAFRRAASAREVTDAQEERFAGARVALERMSLEISQAFLSEHYDHKRFPKERPTLFRGRRDGLLFASMAHERLVRDVRESDQALLEYSLDRDPDFPEEEAVFRREKVRFDDQPDRGGAQVVLCHHVKSLEFAYWDWAKQEWVPQWSTAPGERTFLPTRVQVKLVLKMPDGREEPFETQARIAIVRPLDF